MRRDPARAARKADPAYNSQFRKGYRWIEPPPPWPPDRDEGRNLRRPEQTGAADFGISVSNGNAGQLTAIAAARAIAEALFRPVTL